MKTKRKIIIAGGSGYIGTALSKHFIANNDEVIVLSRSSQKPYVNWDGKTVDTWANELENANLLINLSGKSVDCRYTELNKKLIISSRIESTQTLQQAMEKCAIPPPLWINASTATIYTSSETKIMTEYDNEIGNDFSMSVAKSWEETFFSREIANVRKVAIRTSLVLDENGGVLPVLRKLVRFGFGGMMGKGTQKFAYVKMQELINMIEYIIVNEGLSGPINCTSINDINNEQFMQLLRKKMNSKLYINNPEWLLKIGSIILGTEKELILKSRYVYPQKLKDAGFIFDNDIL